MRAALLLLASLLVAHAQGEEVCRAPDECPAQFDCEYKLEPPPTVVAEGQDNRRLLSGPSACESKGKGICTPCNSQTQEVCAGSTEELVLIARDKNLATVLNIDVQVKDTSVLVGDAADTVAVSDAEYVGYAQGGTGSSGKNGLKRVVSYTPAAGDTSLDLCYQSGQGDNASPEHCFTTEVQYPSSVDLTEEQAAGYTIVTGEKIKFTVSASDANAGDKVDIHVHEGLPAGATLGRSLGSNPATRKFEFRAQDGQHGKVYKVCFSATADGNKNCDFPDEPKCVTITVRAPEVGFIAPTPAGDKTYNTYRGCQTKINLAAGDSNGNYKTDITGDNSVGMLHPQNNLDTLNDVARVFTFTPDRQHEVSEHSACFVAHERKGKSDNGSVHGELEAEVRCYHFKVGKCKYCAKPGETLASIAGDYGTDWLQLYGANTQIEDPDDLSAHHHPLNLGPTYRVVKGDSLSSLATRFGTSVGSIQALNPDLSGDELVAGKTQICVQPQICA